MAALLGNTRETMADSMPRTSACSATFAKPGGLRIIAAPCAIRLQLANLHQPLERCQIVLDLIAIAQPTAHDRDADLVHGLPRWRCLIDAIALANARGSQRF